MNVILEGIVGSTAYGLNHEGSDVDMFGIFVAPTSEILSLIKPQDSIHKTDPDSTYHEIEKFIKLALKGNPTILEALFLEGYTTLTKQGRMLVDNRRHFLSNIIYKSYGGYALDQVRKMNARGGEYANGMKGRYEKNTRHIYRLMQQGRELLETEKLTVRVSNRDELFEIGKLPPDKVVSKFTKDFEEFDKITSVLPDRPNFEVANDILLKIRKGSW